MVPPPDISTWVEADGVKVWLVAGAGRGVVADLAASEHIASSAAEHGAVLAANADADDADRVAQLLSAGYQRVFSMVELQRDLAPIATTPTRAVIDGVSARDADAMHELTLAVWAGRRWFSMPTLDSYRTWLQDADPRLTMLARQEATLVGYVAAREDSTGVEIEDLQVHPTHQRLGIATALLARVVEEAARRRGCRRVWLQTEGDDPVGARRFYERLGFRLRVEHLRFRKPVQIS